VFLLSATHGGETHALAAALATLRELGRHDVVRHLWHVGRRLQDGLNEAARACGLGAQVTAAGYPCSPVITCRDGTGEASPAFRTLFLQEMVARGILIPYVAPSYAHGEGEIERTVEAARGALGVYAQALDAGSVDGVLDGPAVKPVFRRFN
jgi:glutamate-1-semialdehyde 2,1-aminomutase